MRKTHILVLVVVAIAVVMAIGAVSAYGSLASDTTAPTTMTDVAASYWNSAAITATVTDDEGIRYVYHRLDGGVVRLATIKDSPLSTEITIPTAKDSPLAVGEHELRYWAQDVNGNVEAQQVVKFTVLSDTGEPMTTVTGATDGAWYPAGMTVHLAAADGDGESGVKELSYALDGAAPTVVAAEGDVVVPATAGTHTIAYHATDVAGNPETEKTFTVNVDTTKPVTLAITTSVAKGRKATLKYRVTDTGASKATVVIKVRRRNGSRVVATIKAGQVAVNTGVSAKFKCTLAKGVYKYTVYATDMAGNTQSKAGSAKLYVK